MHLNLNHLRVFYYVAAGASFSRAAEQLGVSQPNVSMQVRKLEQTLGVPLVEQVGRALQLTQPGELLYDYARRIFHLTALAEEAMADLKGLHSGQVTLGASTIPGTYLLPPVLGAFRQVHPGIRVRLWIGNTREVEARLAQAELDLAVVGEDSTGHPELDLEPVCRDCLAVIAAPGEPLAAGAPVAPAELGRHPLILREPGSSTREVAEDRLRALGIPVEPVMELAGNDAIKQAVAAGLGWGIISRMAVDWELAAGRLALVRVIGLHMARSFYLAGYPGRRLSPAAAAFRDFLRQTPLPTTCDDVPAP